MLILVLIRDRSSPYFRLSHLFINAWLPILTPVTFRVSILSVCRTKWVHYEDEMNLRILVRTIRCKYGRKDSTIYLFILVLTFGRSIIRKLIDKVISITLHVGSIYLTILPSFSSHSKPLSSNRDRPTTKFFSKCFHFPMQISTSCSTHFFLLLLLFFKACVCFLRKSLLTQPTLTVQGCLL